MRDLSTLLRAIDKISMVMAHCLIKRNWISFCFHYPFIRLEIFPLHHSFFLCIIILPYRLKFLYCLSFSPLNHSPTYPFFILCPTASHSLLYPSNLFPRFSYQTTSSLNLARFIFSIVKISHRSDLSLEI